MLYTIIPSGTTLYNYSFSGTNTVYVICYDFDLDDHTIYSIGATNYLLFDGGTITNGRIYGRTLDGIVRPEWFGAKGNATIGERGTVNGTDDTDAIEMAFRFTELYIYDNTHHIYVLDQNLPDYIHNHATIVFNGTCSYKITRSLYARLGVSIDFNGCTLLPDRCSSGFSNCGAINDTNTFPFILYVNWDKTNHCMFIGGPPRLGSICNVKVGYYDNANYESDLGFIFLAAPMEIHDIFTSHICPVISTPMDSIELSVNPYKAQTCYLDSVSISRVTSIWYITLQYNPVLHVPVIPYLIYKRCHGDSWRVEQLSNECSVHRFEKGFTELMIYGIYFDQTFGLTITNCIHADGVIWRCTDVEYVGNHNERLSLFVNYSNIAIRNCYFVSASDTKASLVLQEDNSDFKPCANTVVLDNITFVIANHSRSYGDFYPQIAIGDNGFPIIEYRDVKTNIFSPSIGDFAMRPTTGFSFSHGGNVYVSHFRRGTIDLTGDTVDVNRGNVLGPVTGNCSVQAQVLNINLFDTEDGFNITDDYYYEIRLINQIASDCYASVIISSSVSAHINSLNECICLRITPFFADGYAVYVKRWSLHTLAVYAILPISYNGILVDWGNWINGISWDDENPLYGSTSLTMESNEHIEFSQSGHVRYYVNNIFKALPWASPALELVDVENPLQTCFTEEDGDRRCYSLQPWAYLRPTTTNVYHVSLGYPTSPAMYQNQIYTIRNGFDDSVVEIRINFPARTCIKTVKGKDFVTVYVDNNFGLYLQFLNSNWHHCDIAILCNQVNNLVSMVNVTNTFPDKPYSQWAGLTAIASSAPSGTTSGRPTNAAAGTYYFDTTIGKPIWSKGNGQWTDANGIIR